MSEYHKVEYLINIMRLLFSLSSLVHEHNTVGMKWSLVYGSMAKMVREPATVGMKLSLAYEPMAKSYNGRTGYESQVIMVGSG